MKSLMNNTLSSGPSLNLEQLDHYIGTAMDQWKVPGLSLAIVKDGQTVVSKGYGIREVGKDIPVGEHTLFPVTAATRLMTASALALLVDEGRLSWDDRLVDLLPGFSTGSELVNQHATLTDALASRIGLDFLGELVACGSRPGLSRRDLLDSLQGISQPKCFRNRRGESYLLPLAAGEVIPAITGISWDDFVQARLFDPLGMTDSITSPALLQGRDNVATPHGEVAGERVVVEHAMTHNVGPALSVYSSAADMAKWLQCQLDNGKVGEQVLIPSAQIDAIRKVCMGGPIGLPGYVPDLMGCGLGVWEFTHRSSGCRVYGLGGDTEGFEAFYVFIPELNLGIAAMVNAYHSIPQRLIPWIIDRYTGAPETDWMATLSDLEERVFTGPRLQLNRLREQLTKPSCPPGLPLDAYTGVYQHPFIGELTIRQTGETLAYTLGEIYQGALPHANHNTFFREPVGSIYNQCLFRGPLRFNLSVEGNVESLTIDDRVFQKCQA